MHWRNILLILFTLKSSLTIAHEKMRCEQAMALATVRDYLRDGIRWMINEPQSGGFVMTDTSAFVRDENFHRKLSAWGLQHSGTEKYTQETYHASSKKHSTETLTRVVPIALKWQHFFNSFNPTYQWKFAPAYPANLSPAHSDILSFSQMIGELIVAEFGPKLPEKFNNLAVVGSTRHGIQRASSEASYQLSIPTFPPTPTSGMWIEILLLLLL